VVVLCSAKLLTTFFEAIVAVTSVSFFLSNGERRYFNSTVATTANKAIINLKNASTKKS